MQLRAIDCWVNVHMGSTPPPEWLVRVKEDYFRAGDEFFRSIGVEELLASLSPSPIPHPRCSASRTGIPDASRSQRASIPPG
jgi:hypothetical protein